MGKTPACNGNTIAAASFKKTYRSSSKDVGDKVGPVVHPSLSHCFKALYIFKLIYTNFQILLAVQQEKFNVFLPWDQEYRSTLLYYGV